MRLAAFLIAALLGFVPALAGAQGTKPPALIPAKCPSGASTADPSGTASFKMTQIDGLKAHLDRLINCANACYDEHISLNVNISLLEGVTLILTTKGTNKCADKSKAPKDQSPPRGCSASDAKPEVTVRIPAIAAAGIPEKTIGPKSRCDAALNDTLDKMFDNIRSGNTAGALENLDTLERLAAPKDPYISRGTIAGSEAITNAFNPDVRQAAAGALNTSDAERARIAGLLGATDTSNASSNRAFLQCIANGCSAEEYRNATDAVGFSLNDDTKTKIASLSPETLASSDGGAGYVRDTISGGNTFGGEGSEGAAAQVQCGTSGIAGEIMYAESRCGRVNSNPLSSVQGPHHYLCSTWQRDTAAVGMSQYSDCRYRNDVQVSSQVVNGVYAQHQQRYGSQCASAGLTWKSCAYGIHVFGEGGFRNMLNAHNANPSASAFSLCGSALSTAACSNNRSIFTRGGTVAGVFGELENRLGGSASIIPHVAQSSSPFNAYNGMGYVATNGSPFGSVNPFYTGTGYSVPTSYSVGGQTYGSAGGSPFSFLTGLMSRITGTNAGTSGSTGTSVPTQGTQPPQGATPPTPVGSIVAQPKEVAAGGSVLVSWTSVGVRSGTTCGVYLKDNAGEIQIAVGYGGSKSITATSTGALGLTLRCMFQGGVTLQQSTSVTVQ